MLGNKNAFDLLRLILASLVFISHGYLIHGDSFEPLAYFSRGQFDLGQLGVLGFFALSGYLITSSFERSSNAIPFFVANRALRIIPGFWVCLLVTGLVIGPAIFYINNHNLTNYNYFGFDSGLSFFYKNMLLQIHQWSVGGLLNSSAYKLSLDGSLWTLWHEAVSYILTIILGSFGLFKKNRQLLILLFSVVYFTYLLKFSVNYNVGPSFLTFSPGLRLYTAYLSGTVLYVFRDKISVDRAGIVFIFLASITLLRFGGFVILAPLIIAIICIKGFELFNFSIKYDISYGLYIYAFPVEQLLYNWLNKGIPFMIYLIICAVITVFLALLSYVAVEKPSLNLKKYYVVAHEISKLK